MQTSLTVWRKILTGENIDEFDEFLSIRQHFPHQNFLLIIFYHLPARPLFSRRALSLVYAPMQKFPYPNSYIELEKQWSIATQDYCTHSKHQQSCTITYIRSQQLAIYLWLRHRSVTVFSHQLFISSAPCITVTLIDTCNCITLTRILCSFTLSSFTFMSRFMMFCL